MSEARALRATACIEKGFYLYPGGELRAMKGFTQKHWKPGYDEQIQAVIQSSTRESRSSFFVVLGSDLALVACAPVGSTSVTKTESVPWVVLAVNLTSGLALQLSHLTQSKVAVGVVEGTKGNSSTAGTTIGRTDDSALYAAKTIPAFNNQTGYLRVTLPRALFGPLISSQFWAFLLFTASLYLSAIIGTTCAAAVVLKPLKRLIELMGSVGGADTYKTRAPEDRSDEIGDLALSFNRLMSRLQMAQRELELVRKEEIEIERLEAIHAMVITVAHEVNNPLTFILGQAELMLMEDDLTPENRNSLEVIRNMSLRIANVIKQLQDLQKAEMTSYIDWQQMIKLEPEPESHVLSG
jgi:signal transduction histidine kinase